MDGKDGPKTITGHAIRVCWTSFLGNRLISLFIQMLHHDVLSLQVPNFLMGQVRKLNENSSRRYQFYDRRIKNLLRKIHTDSREKPDKNSSEVSAGCVRMG